MFTVPAQIFWAPTRAKLIAAARFIPGVCGVLVSSWSPLITRTPLCRQSTVPGVRAAPTSAPPSCSPPWLIALLLRLHRGAFVAPGAEDGNPAHGIPDWPPVAIVPR